MGGDSCSKRCEFESQRRVLYGHFFTQKLLYKLLRLFAKYQK